MATEKVKQEGGAVNMDLKVLLRETVLGYVFWSLIQALPAMIWFYPLNELEISGFEAFAVTLLSPIFFGIGFLRSSCQNRWGLALLRIGALGCIASFQASSTLSRLVILACGCFCIMLVFTATMWSSSRHQRSVTFWGTMLGLLAFISSRIWFTSFVPTWWNDTTNSAVIAIGAIATLDKIISGEDALTAIEKEPAVRPNWFSTGICAGSLFYITYALFGEVSLICRWVVKGYPHAGPMPNPWGAVVLVAISSGLILGNSRGLVTSALWWTVGAVGFFGLLTLPTWKGFGFGVVVAVYVMSLWPQVIDRLTQCPPARTMTLTMAVFIAQILFNVWTVAFNFVPGGVYTREHTDWLIAFVSLTLALATVCAGRKSTFYSRTAFCDNEPLSNVKLLIILLTLVGLAGFVPRQNMGKFNHPAKSQPKVDVTAAIWTYHFGYDNQGWPSLIQGADLLKGTGADVITLLESDASKPFLGNNDLGMWLGEALGMYVDFGPSTRDHTWGNLILSKYPIVKSKHHLLPSPHGELAPGVTATVNISGHLVDFVVTHMGNDRDVLDRKLQAEVLSSELKNAENPVIFLGYVTSSPYSRDYLQLTRGGNVKDIDDTDGNRWCEYIMYRGLIRTGYARISHGGLSDTEVQVGRFQIPANPKNFKDNDRIEKNPSRVDQDVLFNSKFGSYLDGHNWITDHRYHMSTPKYFVRK